MVGPIVETLANHLREKATVQAVPLFEMCQAEDRMPTGLHRHLPLEHKWYDGFSIRAIPRDLITIVRVFAPLQVSPPCAHHQHDDICGEEQKGGKRERGQRKAKPRDDLEKVMRAGYYVKHC